MESWINCYLNYNFLFFVLSILLFATPFAFFLSGYGCGGTKKDFFLLCVYTISLALSFAVDSVSDKIEDKISVCEEKVQEVLVNNHYILPENIKTSPGANISIEKIGKDGTIYFSAGMFDDYLEGNLNKNDLKCQIVSEETILVPDIIKCLSDHHVSLYSADFTGVFDSSSGINGLEGITTDNQLVKVECKDNGKTILTINNEVNG
ncbi:hypothetical protein EGW60_11415 [Enterococcus faecium]|uniref:hypothetical protein n=1 Tax=Enterococcus faecium TaxID=1352 RepID=UPI000F4F611B|nr:hypothetical protein [Enterococcus faecium]ROX59702.1 hypothetical protein EGW10_12040 [Enterococcus faecium]ROX60723.1 hypothetical protein EGW32_12035 [Enterococcus faecium]ROY20847.1 hypothetical protein EGW60_11415 [Enterococcus faecium]ROY78578.1 hypothetical protein EGW71_11695 [Enterococcus faecium]ROY78768.1 hypothetical protein EGW72_11695 [Enterococcus faecium]